MEKGRKKRSKQTRNKSRPRSGMSIPRSAPEAEPERRPRTQEERAPPPNRPLITRTKNIAPERLGVRGEGGGGGKCPLEGEVSPVAGSRGTAWMVIEWRRRGVLGVVSLAGLQLRRGVEADHTSGKGARIGEEGRAIADQRKQGWQREVDRTWSTHPELCTTWARCEGGHRGRRRRSFRSPRRGADGACMPAERQIILAPAACHPRNLHTTDNTDHRVYSCESHALLRSEEDSCPEHLTTVSTCACTHSPRPDKATPVPALACSRPGARRLGRGRYAPLGPFA